MGYVLTDGHAVERISQDVHEHTEDINVGEAGCFGGEAVACVGVSVMRVGSGVGAGGTMGVSRRSSLGHGGRILVVVCLPFIAVRMSVT